MSTSSSTARATTTAFASELAPELAEHPAHCVSSARKALCGRKMPQIAAHWCVSQATAKRPVGLPLTAEARDLLAPIYGLVLLIVKPETVLGWQRAGWRAYWRWRSSHKARGRVAAQEKTRRPRRRSDGGIEAVAIHARRGSAEGRVGEHLHEATITPLGSILECGNMPTHADCRATSGLSTDPSPSPSPDITAVATGRSHRRDFRPLDRQRASLHWLSILTITVTGFREWTNF
jgi:hypothetical protein